MSTAKQLGLDGTVLIQLAIYVLTFLLVWPIALRKLTNTVVERHNRTQGRFQELDHLKKELSELTESLASALKKIRAEAAERFTNLKKKAAEEHRNVVASAREKATLEVDSVRGQIQAQFQGEFARLKAEIPGMAKLLIDKLATPGSLTKSDSSTRSEAR